MKQKFIAVFVAFAFVGFGWAAPKHTTAVSTPAEEEEVVEEDESTAVEEEEVEEEEEAEEEEVVAPAPKKVKKAKKASTSATSDSRFGFRLGFNDELSSYVMAVYDMPDIIRIVAGLSWQQYSTTEFNSTTQLNETKTKNDIGIVIDVEKLFGNGLMPFGVGAELGYVSESSYLTISPYFLVETELVKNLALSLNIGVLYSKEDENEAQIQLMTTAMLTWYFL